MCQGLEPCLGRSPASAASLGQVLSCLALGSMVLRAPLTCHPHSHPTTAATLHPLGTWVWVWGVSR